MVEDIVAPARCRNTVSHIVDRDVRQWRESRVDRRPYAVELLAVKVDRYDGNRRCQVCGRRGSHREDNVCISLERKGSRSTPTICTSSAKGSDVCAHNIVISIIIDGYAITVTYYCGDRLRGKSASC